jgi:hypothetical protein
VLDAHLLAAARAAVASAVDELAAGTSGGPVDEPAIVEAGRQAVRRALGRVLGFKPVTTVVVLRVVRR